MASRRVHENNPQIIEVDVEEGRYEKSPRNNDNHLRLSNRMKQCGILVLFLVISIFLSVNHLQKDGKIENMILLKEEHGGERKEIIEEEEDKMKKTSEKEDNNTSQCTIWLGASSLKGHPGMGVYTTRDINAGSVVLHSGDGIAIPLYGIHHFSAVEGLPNKKARNDMMNVWSDYIWSGNKPDHISYQERGMSSYFPGYASLTNHNCILQSLRQRYIAPFYDDSLLNRYTDPGAGAFSYDKGRGNIVTRNVQAGEELFLNYGYCEHGEMHKGAEWADLSFMPEDFHEASTIIFDLLWKSLRVEGDKLVYDSSSKLPAADDNNNSNNKFVAQLLPKTGKELFEMRSYAKNIDELTWYLAQIKGLNHHDPEWIQSNGICLENFIPGKSTIHQAGNGGIAQFQIKDGEVIAPVPLLQIMDKDALTIYEQNSSSNQTLTDDLEWKEVGKQLLLNYCWGNPDSSLLLCPQTNVVLLNHCSNRTKECGLEGPNAIIRWASSGWHRSTQTWLNISLDEMAKETSGVLAFDVVALRDISPGEEIFIDYGVNWEHAWEEHVQNWQPPPIVSNSSYSLKESWISAKEANEEPEDVLEKLITGDLRKPFVHPYLFTGCQYARSGLDDHPIYNNNTEWEKLGDKVLIATYADDGQLYTKDRDIRYEFHSDHTYWPCHVLKKDSSPSAYTVRIIQSELEPELLPWEKNNLPRLLTNYSLEGIRFFVKPHKSDQHLTGGFRHPIGIPNDMFPDQWKKII